MKNLIALLCAITVSVLLLGCKNEDLSAPKIPKMSETANATTPVSPVGTTPAGPSKEAAATMSKEKSEVSKTDQSASMPLPGQANDHSALVPKTSEFPKTSP
jgi:hypothetical protein